MDSVARGHSSSGPSPSWPATVTHCARRSSRSSRSASASRTRTASSHRLVPRRRQPVLLLHRLSAGARALSSTWSRHWRHSSWRSSTTTLSWATASRGSRDPARPGAACRRQPPAVPGNCPGGRVQPGRMGQPGPETHRRPGRERHPPARVTVRARAGRRAGHAERVRRPQRPVWPVRDRLPLHRRRARASARAHRANLRQRQQLPPPGPADVGAAPIPSMGWTGLREAAVRMASVLRGDPASSINLELKPSDSSANPYLALGAFVHAGLDGIRSKLDPGEAVNVDPATLSDAEHDRLGAPTACPASLERRAGRPRGGRPADDGARAVAQPGLPRGQAVGGGGLRGAWRRIRVLPPLHEDLASSSADQRRLSASPR